MSAAVTRTKPNKGKKKTKSSTKDEDCVGARSRPIHLQITPDISGATDLMKAAYELDVDSVEIALLMDEDPSAMDSKSNTARDYLFAGYNFKQNHFREMHPKSEQVLTEKMCRRDREEYQSLNVRLTKIITLLEAK